jgi:hypothetical protein
MANEISLGVMRFERETKGTRVYSREDNGRKISQYVLKTQCQEIGNPDAIEVVVRPAS